MSESYVTTYCNFPHRMRDGKPINHECRVIPLKVLRLETEDKISEAIEVMKRSPMRMCMGVKE